MSTTAGIYLKKADEPFLSAHATAPAKNTMTARYENPPVIITATLSRAMRLCDAAYYVPDGRPL
jgi:hypothetical protein